MSCNTGLPKIFTKKNTGIIDIIVFIIKYCLLFDTSSLFVNEKMTLNSEIKRNKSGGGSNGFDLMEFFLLDIGNKSMVGGADVTKYITDNLTPEEKRIQDKEAQNEIYRERDREQEYDKRDDKKTRIREEIESDLTSQIDEGVSMDTGLKGDDELRKDITCRWTTNK